MQHISSDFARQTILIVEDDESIADVLQTAIYEETSYQPVLAHNGKDAVQKLQRMSVTPHLLILDYYLRDMTGIHLYDYLQSMEEFQNVPALLMSTVQPSEQIEPRNIVLMSKPFDLDDFLSQVHTLISTHTPVA
jgi:DNA-binding response OmpR family regulator